MPDIFGRTGTSIAGVFTADNARMSFGGGVPTALIQNFNATYAQNITRLYEINTNNKDVFVYYVGGRTSGQLGIARVIGPASLIGAFYQAFGNVCNAKNNTLDFALSQADCSQTRQANRGGAAARYIVKFCVLAQVGITVGAQDMIINEQGQMIFSNLEYQGN